MDCTTLLREEIEAVDFSTVDSFLVIANTRRANWLIDRLKLTGKNQHFGFMGFNTKLITGHYDVAVIDGGDEGFDAKELFEELYPYLKRNVKAFYILKD